MTHRISLFAFRDNYWELEVYDYFYRFWVFKVLSFVYNQAK